MKNVLVFPCGSEIGLELERCLSQSAHCTLWGASSTRDHGAFAYENYVERLPMVYDPAFLPAFNQVLRDRDIEYVFPAHDDAIVALARWRDAGRLAAEPILPSRETCEVCRSKRASYQRFAGKIAVPAIRDPGAVGAGDFPLFVKPDAGQGSRGAVRVDDMAAAREALRRVPDPLLLEYLPGDEYTVDCFTDRHGALRFVGARGRRRVSGGISVNAYAAEDPRFAAIAGVINDEMDMRGPWFFQLRKNAAGDPVLLEVAARIAGSSGFQRARGVNLPLLALYDRMGLDVDIIVNPVPDLEMDRALAGAYRARLACEAVYIDYDDTLFFKGRVNADVVRLVFLCRNRGIRAVLLSRHAGDLAAELEKRRLAGIFDAVIHVPPDQPKSAHIAEKRAVLIDDSFAERREVAKALGIPVFDATAVDMLAGAFLSMGSPR